MFKICSLTLFTFLFSLNVNAAVLRSDLYFDMETRYPTETKALIQLLENLGFDEILCLEQGKDCLSLSQMQETFGQIQFKVVQGFDKPEFSTRKSLFYSPGEKIIYINFDGSYEPALAGCLGFHELLGILGREEPEYQYSMAICTLLNEFNSDLQTLEGRIEVYHFLKEQLDVYEAPKTNSIIHQANQTLKRSGGGTIVGGGGDSLGLNQRILFYDFLKRNNPDLTVTELFEILSDVPIEVKYYNPNQKNKVSYIWDEQNGLQHILIPVELLAFVADNTFGPLAVGFKDIGFYLASLNPKLFKAYNLSFVRVNYRNKNMSGSFIFPRDVMFIHSEAYKHVYKKLWHTHCEAEGAVCEFSKDVL